MKALAAMATAILIKGVAVFASQVPDEGALLRAIWRAEGGWKARAPYGVLSVQVRSRDHAREVVLRTIRRARKDWDGSGDFVSFLGRRYCPPGDDPSGHRNWVRNVRRYLDRTH